MLKTVEAEGCSPDTLMETARAHDVEVVMDAVDDEGHWWNYTITGEAENVDRVVAIEWGPSALAEVAA